MFFDTVNLKPSTDRMTAQHSVTQARMPVTELLPPALGMESIDRTQRWKRSLRAPMVFRSLSRLLTHNVSLSRSGSPA